MTRHQDHRVRFHEGELIVHRNVRHGRIGWIRPVRVVSDDDRGLLFWLAPGTPIAYEVTSAGEDMRSMPFEQWLVSGYRLDTGAWHGRGNLMFTPTGAAHSVWWQWGPDGSFAGWYVNLEEPLVRWRDADLSGVDVVDQDLDVVVDPQRVALWKDEDEFAHRLAFGARYWVTDERAVRAEGERAVAAASRGEFPFDGTWCDFRPPADWAVPAELPPGCLRPPAPRP